MAHDYHDRVLALAGMVQASWLLSNAAHKGMISQDSFDGCLGSLFEFDPDSTLEVFGGIEPIRPGLKMTAQLLTHLNVSEHADQIRYVLSMIAVERRLSRQPEMFAYIGRQLRRIGENLVDADDSEMPLSDNVVAAVAELYQKTISTMTPRIKILGNRHHLRNEYNVNRIRALLLAGIRSAVLWRQTGGRRWQLVLARNAMRRALDDLINA